MTDFETRAAARRAIRETVLRDGGQMVARPLIRSEPDGRTTQEPEPLAGIAAAVALERAARRQCLESVRYAREDGLTWHAIGEAMGFADDPQPGMTSVAERAFCRAASDLGSGPSFTWACPSCGKLVRDHGPESGPHDAEQGHAGGCERFAAAVRAWDAQWEEGGDGLR